MYNTEAYQLMSTIIDQAQAGQFTEFQFLHNWDEYKFYKGKCRAYRLLVKTLQKSTNRLFKSYCSSVTQGSCNFTKLLAYHQMLQTINYYKTEIVTITDMILEYEAYLTCSNFLYAFLGATRAEEDLIDFRGRY